MSKENIKLYFWLCILWLGGVLCGVTGSHQYFKNQIIDTKIDGIECLQKLISKEEVIKSYQESFAQHAKCLRACTSEENHQ